MAEAERAYRNALHHRGNMADMLYNLWVDKNDAESWHKGVAIQPTLPVLSPEIDATEKAKWQRQWQTGRTLRRSNENRSKRGGRKRGGCGDKRGGRAWDGINARVSWWLFQPSAADLIICVAEELQSCSTRCQRHRRLSSSHAAAVFLTSPLPLLLRGVSGSWQSNTGKGKEKKNKHCVFAFL